VLREYGSERDVLLVMCARAAVLMPTSWDKHLGGTDIFLTDNLNAVGWSLHND